MVRLRRAGQQTCDSRQWDPVRELKRCHSYDLPDIEAMVDRRLVDHGLLIERFREPVDGYSLDARVLSVRAGSQTRWLGVERSLMWPRNRGSNETRMGSDRR
jgi:hypothetical protein